MSLQPIAIVLVSLLACVVPVVSDHHPTAPAISGNSGSGGVAPCPLSSVPQVSGIEPYAIGAWYFTAWSDTNTFQAANAVSLFGSRDPWGGVREYALGQDPWNLGVNYSSREPLLGFYDLTDQATMDAHIRQAASHGLTYFAFYWYWDMDSNQEFPITAQVKDFIHSPYKGDMSFLVAPLFVGRQSMTLQMWDNNVVPDLVNNYVSDSSYLRTTDGRPIISDWGGFVNDSAHQQAVAFLRSYVESKLGVNPVILGLAQEGNTQGDLCYAQSLLNLDGFMCFTPYPDTTGVDYPSTLAQLVPTLESQGMPFNVPCSSSGEDQRPWWHVGEGWQFSNASQMSYFTNMGLPQFQYNLDQLKQYIDHNVTQTSRMLTLYAWTEWGEGGAIEPSWLNGYDYLNLIQSVFGLTAKSAEPTVNPDAGVLVSLRVPQILEGGQVASASVTMRNTGTTTWTSAGGYALGSLDPENNTLWGLDRVGLGGSESIAPGQTKTFLFSIDAPLLSGQDGFRWRMIHSGTGWFGDFVPTQTITISPPGVFIAPLASPNRIDVGQRVVFSAVTVAALGPLQYSWLGLPTGCTSSDTANLSCVPTGSGNFTVSYEATDSSGGVAYSSLRPFTVATDPRLSSFSASPSVLELGKPFSLRANASGGTGPLSYSFSGLPPGCESTNAATFSCLPNQTGKFHLVATVTDGAGFQAVASTNVTILAAPTSSLGLTPFQEVALAAGISGVVVAAVIVSVTFWKRHRGRSND